MTVSSQTTINTSTANGVTTVFPYQFKILDAADLRVTVNGLARTLGTHYTVDGVGVSSGGNITFESGFIPPDGALVMRRRLMLFERDTNYQTLGDLIASTLNDDQDAPVMMIQQLAALAMQLIENPNGDGSFVWDAQNNRIINLGDAVDPKDAVNLSLLLTTIEDTINGTGPTGGSTSVSPKYWEFTGDGSATDFDLAGADVANLLFYDVYLAGVGQEPYDDFTIVGNDTDGYVVRFAVAPTNAVEGWAVLRGYARPYSGTPPIITVAPVIQTIADTPTDSVDGTSRNTLFVVTSATPVTITIKVNTGLADDWKAGEFFSVLQLGAGKITLAIEGGGNLVTPSGFDPSTRGQYSVISASCVYADSDEWVASGDLLATTSTPDIQCFTLPCSDEKTTNLATGTSVYSFRMPYGLLLSDIRATVNVAQAAGTVLTFDVNKNGTSILSTKLTIDNAEFTTTTSSTAPVMSDNVLGDGDLITVDIDQVGTALAKGLKIQLIGQRA